MPWQSFSPSWAVWSRPAVRINQAGYPGWAPKVATVVMAEPDPVPFHVERPDGRRVHHGRTQPWPVRPDPSSGLVVHRADFTGLTGPGAGLRVVVGAARSHPFDVGGNPHVELASHALDVLRLMRSGDPVGPDHPAHQRPAGHLGVGLNTGDTSVPAWTGAEAELLYPGWTCPGQFDVSGGWYDAGDYGKYVTSGGVALWQLLLVIDLLGDRLPLSLVERLHRECRWQLDWMVRMQVPEGFPLAGTVFHKVHGTTWSPLPGLPHDDPTTRVLHRPSTAATWHLAAVAAQAARVLSPADPGCREPLLEVARSAADAAGRHPDLLAPDHDPRFGGGAYPDEDPTDDAYWAAVELWLATGHPDDLRQVRESPWHTAEIFPLDGFDFDRMATPARLDLALRDPAPADGDGVRDSVLEAAAELLRLQSEQPWAQPYAPADGWAWGSNGRLLNNLVVLAVAHELDPTRVSPRAVAEGVDHLLGRNALGQSYVTGFGVDDSRQQRTRLFGHALDPTLPPPPRGALAGGANSVPSPGFPYDERLLGLPPQWCYLDEPTSEVTNDLCIRWNAPLVFVAAWLAVVTDAEEPVGP